MMKIILAAAMLLTASLAAPAQMRLVADTLDLGLVEHGGRVSGTIMIPRLRSCSTRREARYSTGGQALLRN